MISVLLDKDVVLDYLLGRGKEFPESAEVVNLCKSGRITGWILDDTVSEALRFCSEELGKAEAIKRVRESLEFLSKAPLIKKGILSALSESHQDYERAIQLETCRASRFNFLVTKGVSHTEMVGGSGDKKDVRILTPKELLDEIAKENVSSVPALDLKRELHTFWDEAQGELNRLAFSTNFIMGDSVKRFEEEFAKYCNTEHCVAVASGSDALLISLMAINTGPHDAVITTPYTFFATAGAITRLFALPVFVDIDPATYNIDARQIEKLIENSCDWDGENLWIEVPNLKPSFWNPEYFLARRRVRAIIPVHLFGQSADMGKIMEIARKYNLYVIEDAAQAHGAEYGVRNGYDATKPKRIGSIGHFGCFSFFPTKNLGCWGDGGAVTTNDPQLAERVRVLRVHGSKPKYYHKLVGINSRLDTVQAAVLLAKLPYLDNWIEKRQDAAMRYMDLLSSKENITLPEVAGYASRHVWNQFIVRISGNGKRNEVQKNLKEKGIETAVYYPLSLHMQECFSYLGYKEGDFPYSEKAARETLALPMYPELVNKEQEEVARRLGEIL